MRGGRHRYAGFPGHGDPSLAGKRVSVVIRYLVEQGLVPGRFIAQEAAGPPGVVVLSPAN